MKVNYSVAFKLDDWTEDVYFKRDLFDEMPLDETLDSGIIVDVPAPLRKIQPFTLCRITTTDAETDEVLDKRYYFTSDRETSAATLFNVDNSLDLSEQTFHQRVQLIELTKILEREPCDSLSFTHRISKVIANAYYVEPTVVHQGTAADIGIRNSQLLSQFYTSPRSGGLALYYLNVTYSIYVTPRRLSIELLQGSTVITSYNNISISTSTNTGDVYTHITFNNIGNLTLRYTLEYTRSIDDQITYGSYIVTYNFTQANFDVVKPIPSITDVINRILDVGQPRPAYKAPKYTLDATIAAKYQDVPAPEFFFPRMTMFEALLEVGRKIQAIPRLTVDNNEEPTVITYDLLGLDDTYTLPDDAEVIGYKNLIGSEDYCGGLDSYVDNHINTVDPNAGSVTEPFNGGFKTLRSASGATVTNANAVFEVSRPIYRVLKFEMAYTSASTGEIIGDITQYVYEQAEYDALQTDSGILYPNSKAHALVWRQGDKYIRGFNTTSTAVLNIIQQFMKPSIFNIVKDEAKQISTSEIYGNLAFRLTYIPMDNLRLRQYKPYNTHARANLLYNQQNANTVEASYYGENLKGKLARMGNETEVYTVRFKSMDNLPKLGAILIDKDGNDKGYIYKLTNRRARDFLVSDIYVTPDFNRLSEYFSLESNFRLFEVSEKQSIDRQITVPRVIRIGFEKKIPNEPTLATLGGRFRFISTFTQEDSTLVYEDRPTLAYVRLVNRNYERINDYAFCLPVNSAACGNSLAFSFSFDNSFSAGKRNVGTNLTTSDPTGSDGSGGTARNYTWKAIKDSPYGGVAGDFWGLQFSLSDRVRKTSGVYTPTWGDQSTAGGFCDSLPTIDDTTYQRTYEGGYFTTYGDNTKTRVVDKNSSEHISVVVQFHGVCEDKRIVMGQAMWNNNLLIRDDPVKVLDAEGNPTSTNRQPPHVYGLKGKRLNMLRSRIDLQDTTHVVDLGVFQSTAIDNQDLTPSIESMTLSGQYDAWCIADSVYGDIYIGVNEKINNSATSTIYFNFDEEA